MVCVQSLMEISLDRKMQFTILEVLTLPVSTRVGLCTCVTICPVFCKIKIRTFKSRNPCSKRRYWNTRCNKYIFVQRMQIMEDVMRCIWNPSDPRQRTPIAKNDYTQARFLWASHVASSLPSWNRTQNLELVRQTFLCLTLHLQSFRFHFLALRSANSRQPRLAKA